MTTPSMLDELVAMAPAESERPVTDIVESVGYGHLTLLTRTRVATKEEPLETALFLIDLGGYMQICSGCVDLTPDQARAVGDHLRACADRTRS